MASYPFRPTRQASTLWNSKWILKKITWTSVEVSSRLSWLSNWPMAITWWRPRDSGPRTIWPTLKQFSVRLNGTLISPQTDNYHYKVYLETLLNYNKDDGETVLKPHGWYNALDLPTELTANNTNTEGEGHEAFQPLSSNQQASVKLMKAEQSSYTDGKRHVLRFTPHIECSH